MNLFSKFRKGFQRWATSAYDGGNATVNDSEAFCKEFGKAYKAYGEACGETCEEEESAAPVRHIRAQLVQGNTPNVIPVEGCRVEFVDQYGSFYDLVQQGGNIQLVQRRAEHVSHPTTQA